MAKFYVRRLEKQREGECVDEKYNFSTVSLAVNMIFLNLLWRKRMHLVHIFYSSLRYDFMNVHCDSL